MRPPPHSGAANLRLLAWLAGLVVISVALLCAAAEGAMHFDSYAMDGPFQLFNALRRISVGQRIGDTFQFFHGPGIPYLFFPAFAAAGKTFLAAEVTRQLLAVSLFIASTTVMCRALAGNWKSGIPLAVIATLVIVEFRLDGLIYPLNSLLGVRSTMPIFVAAHMLMRSPGRRADLERGILLGLALLLGTEQGMACLAALFLTRAALSLRHGQWRAELTRFAVEVAAAVAVFMAVVTLLAGSHTGSVLRFNFREVPMDQLWYFGVPPNPFLSSWSEIPPMVATRPRWFLTFAVAIVIAAFGLRRSGKESDARPATTNVFLVLYALISLTSMLGIFILAYALPATRVVVFVVLGWLLGLWSRWSKRIPEDRAVLRHAIPVIATIGLIVVSFARENDAMMALARSPVHVIRDHLFGPQRAAMSNAWVETQITGLAQVEQSRRATGHTPVLWSTYAGLLEWKIGVFHPATDYIIHTLGPKRRSEYAAQFVALRPDLVQTIRPSHIWYEEWLEGTHWNFYRPLLERYDISGIGPWSFFWRPRPGPPLPPGNVIVNMAVPSGATTISTDPHLPIDSVGVFEVRIRYRTRNPLHALPVVGGLPRYFIDLVGSADRYPVSLPPYATERSFPVVIRGGSPITVRGRVASLVGGATLTLDSVRIERIPISRLNAIWLRDYVTRNPSDR